MTTPQTHSIASRAVVMARLFRAAAMLGDVVEDMAEIPFDSLTVTERKRITRQRGEIKKKADALNKLHLDINDNLVITLKA